MRIAVCGACVSRKFFADTSRFPADARAVELKAEPAHHVGRRRVDRSGRRQLIHVRVRDDAHGVIDLGVRAGDVCELGQNGDGGVRRRHSERHENAIADELGPRAVRNRLRDFTGGGIHQIAVSVMRAKAPRRPEKTKPPEQLIGVVRPAARPEQVAARKPAPVSDQIADGELARHPRIGELERRQMIGDAIIPVELAIVNEHRQQNPGERLAVGCKREESVRIYRVGLSDRANPVTLEQNDRVVANDSDGDTRNFPLAHPLRDVGVEIGNRELGDSRGRECRHAESEQESEIGTHRAKLGMRRRIGQQK